MTNRRVADGFLLVFHIHCSTNFYGSQDFQPSNIKPEAKIAVSWRRREKRVSSRLVAVGFL
jgi:hypothetical protein